MATILEGTKYCPLCSHEEHHEKKPLFGNLSLSGVDLVMDSSGFARSLISSINATTQRENPPTFSALGLTTMFGLVGGVVSLHESLHDKSLMDKIKDVTGKILTNLKCARAGIQTVAGALYIPVRCLSVGAYMTGSKSMAALSGLLGQIGGGLFTGVGLLFGISTFMRIDEVASFAIEVDQVIEGNSSLSEQEKAEACLAFLKGKLALTPEEEASPERESIREGKYSALSRLLTTDLVDAIETATPEDAIEIQSRVEAQYTHALLTSAFTLILCGLGMAATVLALASTSQTALLVSAGINTFTALCSFISTLFGVIKTLEKPTTGRYDTTLLVALSVVCLSAITLTPLLPDEQLFQIITGSLGLFWLGVNFYVLARVIQIKHQKKVKLQQTRKVDRLTSELDPFLQGKKRRAVV